MFLKQQWFKCYFDSCICYKLKQLERMRNNYIYRILIIRCFQTLTMSGILVGIPKVLCNPMYTAEGVFQKCVTFSINTGFFRVPERSLVSLGPNLPRRDH